MVVHTAFFLQTKCNWVNLQKLNTVEGGKKGKDYLWFINFVASYHWYSWWLPPP